MKKEDIEKIFISEITIKTKDESKDPNETRRIGDTLIHKGRICIIESFFIHEDNQHVYMNLRDEKNIRYGSLVVNGSKYNSDIVSIQGVIE
jgi:hypothetical protein